jgi:hypothetical protein
MNNAGYQGQASLYSYDMRDSYPVYLRVGHGGRLYVGAMGQGSGQRRNLQNDFTRIFSTLIGGMIGFLSGIKLNQRRR